jgi:hypothetical protein
VCGRTPHGEDLDQPRDRVGQPRPPLYKPRLLRQDRKQVRKLALGQAQEAAIAGRTQHHLGDTQRHHLRIGQPPSPIPRLGWQEIISRAINSNQEQVEVGGHRGLQGRR